MNLLSVENLYKAYGDKQLFSGISFGIEQGQRVALVAKNGAGKSTLLKILQGGDIADSGNVTFRNDIAVSFLEQEPNLIPMILYIMHFSIQRMICRKLSAHMK